MLTRHESNSWCAISGYNVLYLSFSLLNRSNRPYNGEFHHPNSIPKHTTKRKKQNEPDSGGGDSTERGHELKEAKSS